MAMEQSPGKFGTFHEAQAVSTTFSQTLLPLLRLLSDRALATFTCVFDATPSTAREGLESASLLAASSNLSSVQSCTDQLVQCSVMH